MSAPAREPVSALVKSAVRSGLRPLAAAILRGDRAHNTLCAGLLVLPSGALPDGVTFTPSPGGCHVGAVPIARAAELVAARSSEAAEMFKQHPPKGNRWCVVIGAAMTTLVPLTVPYGIP